MDQKPNKSMLATKRLLGLLLGGWMLGQSSLAANDHLIQVKFKQNEWQQLNRHIKQLQQEIQCDSRTKMQLVLQLQKSQAQLVAWQQRLLVFKQNLDQKQTLLTQLSQRYQANHHVFSQQKQLMNTQLRLGYGLSFSEANQALLPYFRYLNQAHIRFLNQLVKTLMGLQDQQQAVQKQKIVLQTRFNKQKLNQAQHSTIQTQQQRNLKQLNNQLQAKNNQLKGLLANRQALEQLLKQLAITYKNREPGPPDPVKLPTKAAFTHWKTKLAWPIQAPLSAHFGSRIEQSELRYTGVLIAAKLGQPVHVIYQGRVVFAGQFRGLGLLLIVDHGDGYLSLYGHNQVLRKKAGEWVNTGEPIANAGIPDRRSLAQLYFEIRYNSQPLNPEHWCKKH